MKVSVIGLGVGYGWAVLLASQGYEVVGVDKNPKMVENPRKELSVLEWEIRYHNEVTRNLTLTTDYNGIIGSEYIFEVVATPFNEENKRREINYLVDSINEIKNHLHPPENPAIVVNSTIPFGASKTLVKACKPLPYVYAPMMVTQGTLMRNFTHPRFLMIGSYNTPIGHEVKEFYHRLFKLLRVNPPPTFVETPEIVELTKMTANAFLSTKITFANQIGTLCEKLGIDGVKILEMAGSDPRIGTAFLKPGYGFGGDCLPYDLTHLIEIYEKHEVENELFKTIEVLNRARILVEPLVRIMETGFDHKRDKIAILGLTYKENITDTRGSPALLLKQALEGNGFYVETWDKNIEGGEELNKVLENAKIIIVTTRDPSFKNLPEIYNNPFNPVVLDYAGVVENLPKGVKLFQAGKGWIKT